MRVQPGLKPRRHRILIRQKLQQVPSYRSDGHWVQEVLRVSEWTCAWLHSPMRFVNIHEIVSNGVWRSQVYAPLSFSASIAKMMSQHWRHTIGWLVFDRIRPALLHSCRIRINDRLETVYCTTPSLRNFVDGSPKKCAVARRCSSWNEFQRRTEP